MKRGLLVTLAAALFGAVVVGWLSRPQPLDPAVIPTHPPDPENGQRLFHAGGCASCHGEEIDGELSRDRLAGGLALSTLFGTFHAPNISPDPVHGIGAWGREDFVNAMLRGLAPDGRHYYPSFPYPSYARMSVDDVLDLKAYLDRLPPVSTPSQSHQLPFPFRFRRLLGLWKRLYLDAAPVRPVGADNELLRRGRYLVEGPGHCGECHTPRNLLGAARLSAWLQGAPSLEGEGRVPDITNSSSGLAEWSEADLVFFLETGIDPEFDVVGGSMVEVQENLARLPETDRAAIAAYLKSLD